MNKIIKNTILIMALFLCLHFTFIIKAKLNRNTGKSENFSVCPAKKNVEEKKEAELSGIGEKLIYDVKLGSITLGKSIFSHDAKVKAGEKTLHLMFFETKLPRFSDTEKIYTDPLTLLPVKIERDILNLFSREKITEIYNDKQFSVKITKKTGNKEQTLTIKKDSPINNAILLPHYVRRIPDLKLGKVIIANLPNRKYELTLSSIEDITVPAGIFNTYHFESIPKQIDIWISTDEHRLPVKIKNSGTFNYLMVLREHCLPTDSKTQQIQSTKE